MSFCRSTIGVEATKKTDREALFVKRADAVVLVPAHDWSRITDSDAVQHRRVALVGGRVHRPHFEPRPHCTHHQHLNYYCYYIRLTAFFPGLRTTWVSRRQKGKPFWILLEQEMTEWQWHQLDHMQIICISFQTDNHARTSSPSFYRPDALPAAQPTASKQRQHLNAITNTPAHLPTFQPPPF